MKTLIIIGMLCQLSAPSNITTKDISTNKVEFNWTKDECAEEYFIRYKKLGTFTWYRVTVKNIPYTLTLPTHDAYVYQVASSNSKGVSEWSDYNTIVLP
jgi:hypothetical protein